MNGQDLAAGSLLASMRSYMILRPWSIHNTWLHKGMHLMLRGHHSKARDLLQRSIKHARWGLASRFLRRAGAAPFLLKTFSRGFPTSVFP
jgi:hypothetical protein